MKRRVYLHHCAPVRPGVIINGFWHEKNTLGLPQGCPGVANFTGYASNFWSASPNANNSSNAWNVNFNNGNANMFRMNGMPWVHGCTGTACNRDNNNRVRLVRSGE